MLRQAISLFICFSFTACMHTQVQVDNSLVRMHLKGSVYAITETTWQSVTKGDSSVLLQVVDTFSKNGLLISENYFYGKTSVEDSSRSRYTYQYDKNSNRVSDSMYLEDTNKQYYYYAIHTYDSLGNIVRWNIPPFVNITYKYQYDKNGRPVEKLERDSREDFTIRHTYDYDNIGNLFAELKYITTDNKEEINKLLWQIHNRYDTSGNIIAQKSYAIDSTRSLSDIYSYQVDKAGNWIKKITYTNGEYSSTTKRQITYY